jgi:hypothetical protein
VYYERNHQKKILISRFFLSIFQKMKLKNNVCLNLTTQTSKYRLDVSQLSHQCFTGFLLSLLSKKSKHFFFNFFENDQKIIFRVLAGNCKKIRLNLLQMFWGILDKRAILQIYPRRR